MKIPIESSSCKFNIFWILMISFGLFNRLHRSDVHISCNGNLHIYSQTHSHPHSNARNWCIDDKRAYNVRYVPKSNWLQIGKSMWVYFYVCVCLIFGKCHRNEMKWKVSIERNKIPAIASITHKMSLNKFIGFVELKTIRAMSLFQCYNKHLTMSLTLKLSYIKRCQYSWGGGG